MKNSAQVIVVGGGPAGISAAITLARAGKKVVLIERGNFSGAKNVFGGAIYTKPTAEIFPDFEEKAPLERKIVQHKYLIRTQDKEVSVGYFSEKDNNAYSVMRGKFDRWMAEEAKKAGVIFATETVVRELIVQEEKVIGVRTELENYYADIVILADGVNSLLAKQIGLRKEIKPNDVALAVKEVLKLPKEKIEERFNLSDGEGCAYELIGDPMTGMLGMGFLYTNKDSISIGLGIGLDELIKRKLKPYEVLDKMKSHPAFKNLLKDAEIQEYSAHLIPEGGYKKIPTLYADGVMIVGDAAMLVNNVHFEGTNLAMMSGKYAAETAIQAIEKEDFSKNALSLYQKKLEKSFVIKDLRTYKNVMDIAHDRNASYFGYYLQKITDFFEMFTTVDGVPKTRKYRTFIRKFVTSRSLSELIKDGIGFMKILFGVIHGK